jgi:hypothetical protein
MMMPRNPTIPRAAGASTKQNQSVAKRLENATADVTGVNARQVLAEVIPAQHLHLMHASHSVWVPWCLTASVCPACVCRAQTVHRPTTLLYLCTLYAHGCSLCVKSLVNDGLPLAVCITTRSPLTMALTVHIVFDETGHLNVQQKICDDAQQHCSHEHHAVASACLILSDV